MRLCLGKRTRALVVLGVLTILMLALAAQVAGAATLNATVSGRVTDTKGSPIAGIWVQLHRLEREYEHMGRSGYGCVYR